MQIIYSLLLILASLQTIVSQTCLNGQFYNSNSLTCEQCHESCDSWCIGPESYQCISCPIQDGKISYRNFETWECLFECPISSFPISIPHYKLTLGFAQNQTFNYCRGFEVFVDPSSNFSNIELGTKLYPFKALDDPFREIFNYASDRDLKFVVNLKHNTNLTILTPVMPLVQLNSQIKLQPYTSDPSIDLTKSLTVIQIHLSNYYRPTSNFNPTISRSDWLTNPYLYDKWISTGLLKSSLKSDTKYKFMSYNASLIVENFHFIEFTYAITTTNSLFLPGYSTYRWMNITNCKFDLKMQFMSVLQGINVHISKTIIDVTLINRVGLFVASKICKDMISPGATNNFIMDNSTITGFAQKGYTYIFFWQYHYNITFTNNIIRDFQWPQNSVSMNIWHWELDCPGINPFTEYKVINNSFYNKDASIVPGVYFSLVFAKLGLQKVQYVNNSFVNLTFWDYPNVQVAKTGMVGLESIIKNIYFENTNNKITQMPFIFARSANTMISNITVKNSQVFRFMYIECINTTVSDINLLNVSGQYNSSLSNGFFEIQNSQNVTLRNVQTPNIKLSNSRLVTILSSSQIYIHDISTINGEIANNNYFYMARSRDILISNITVKNLQKVTSVSLYGFMIQNLEPQYSATQAQPLYYNFTNISVSDSSFEFFNLENTILNQTIIKSGQNYTGEMVINLSNIQLRNITLTKQSNMFSIKEIQYNLLNVQMSDMKIENCSLDTGYFFTFKQNTQKMLIQRLTFFKNTGFMMIMIPADTMNMDLPQIVTISNSSIRKNFAGPSALIYHSQNSQLSVKGCVFEENFSVGLGSIVFAEDDFSSSELVDTKISSNYAYFGGVFFAQQSGFISCKNCQIDNNFAIIGGVSYSQNFGYANFKNCSIFQNKALLNSIVFAINSQNFFTIEGGEIYSNGILYNQTWMIQLQAFSNLRDNNQQIGDNLGLNPSYLLYLAENYQTQVRKELAHDQYSDNPQISIIKAMLILTSGLVIRDQQLFLECSSGSDAYFTDIQMLNITSIDNPLIISGESNIDINGMKVKNISTSSFMISIDSISFVRITETEITETSGSIIYSQSSYLSCLNLYIHDVIHTSLVHPLISILKSNIHLDQLSMINLKASQTTKELIAIESTVTMIGNSLFDTFDTNLIQASSGDFILYNSVLRNGVSPFNEPGLAITLFQASAFITNSLFENLQSYAAPCIYAYDKFSASQTQNVVIQSSNFSNNHAQTFGGAVYFLNYDGKFYKSNFDSNFALTDSGGSVKLSCSTLRYEKCQLDVDQNSFSNNKAFKNGGAIFYDLYTPDNLETNVFDMNSAQYGDNFASYPFSIKLIDSNNLQTNFASGQKYQDAILLGIFDQNKQLISNDNTSEALLTSDDIQVIVSQNNKVQAVNGIFRFENITLIAKPSYITKIKFVTTDVDTTLYKLASGQNYKDYEVEISFRSCNMGEITQNNMCVECSRGSYSFDPSGESTTCLKCFSNALCLGRNVTQVDPGFWRSSALSSTLYQCPNIDSCLGGQYSECETGYEGIFCQVCSKDVNGTRYSKQGSITCVICEELSLQIMKLIAILALIAAYVAYMLYSLLNSPKRNKPQTVLIRIITSYFHAIYIVKDFDLEWPSQVQIALDSISFVTSSTQTVFSFDCFFQFQDRLEMPLFYIKLIIFGLLPIALSAISAGVWWIIYKVCQQRGKVIQLEQCIQVTAFIFCYLCYPIITNQNFSAFSCKSLDNGKSYLKSDLTIECWTPQHKKYALAVSLPLIIIWTIGFPLTIFRIMSKSKREFYNLKYISTYGLFFIGLNDQSYFWEIVVVNGRKLMFIICQTLLFFMPQESKALIGVIILLLQVYILERQKPYIDPRFNTIEKNSIYAAVLILYGGVFFVQSEVKKNNDSLFVLFLSIVLYNMYFLCSWAYRFISILFRIHSKYLKRVPFCWFLKKYQIYSYEEDVAQMAKRQRHLRKSINHLSLNSFYENPEKDQSAAKDSSLSIRQINDTRSFRSQSIMESDRGLLISRSQLQSQLKSKGNLRRNGNHGREESNTSNTQVGLLQGGYSRAQNVTTVLDVSQMDISSEHLSKDTHVEARTRSRQMKGKNKGRSVQRGVFQETDIGQVDSRLMDQSSIQNSAIDIFRKAKNPQKLKNQESGTGINYLKATYVPTFSNYQAQNEDQNNTQNQMVEDPTINEDPFQIRNVASPPSFSPSYNKFPSDSKNTQNLSNNGDQHRKLNQRRRKAPTQKLSSNISIHQNSSLNSQASLSKLSKNDSKAKRLFKQVSQVVKFKSRAKSSSKQVNDKTLDILVEAKPQLRNEEKQKDSDLVFQQVAEISFSAVKRPEQIQKNVERKVQDSLLLSEQNKALAEKALLQIKQAQDEKIQKSEKKPQASHGWNQLKDLMIQKKIISVNSRYDEQSEAQSPGIQQAQSNYLDDLQTERLDNQDLSALQQSKTQDNKNQNIKTRRGKKNVIIKVVEETRSSKSSLRRSYSDVPKISINVEDVVESLYFKLNRHMDKPNISHLDQEKVKQLQLSKDEQIIKLKREQQEEFLKHQEDELSKNKNKGIKDSQIFDGLLTERIN